jgi:hypothetical protein
MTDWIKIEKTQNSSGRQPRTTFAVSRSRKNPDSTAKLICPTPQITNDMADPYASKDGHLLRFQMVEKGEYSIQTGKGAGHTRSITIPSAASKRLPLGLTEAVVDVDLEEGFLTMDLRQFDEALKAQEEAGELSNDPAKDEAPAKRAAKKAPAKKAPAKKPAARKPAPKKAPAKKPAAETTEAPADAAPAGDGDGDDLL